VFPKRQHGSEPTIHRQPRPTSATIRTYLRQAGQASTTVQTAARLRRSAAAARLRRSQQRDCNCGARLALGQRPLIDLDCRKPGEARASVVCGKPCMGRSMKSVRFAAAAGVACFHNGNCQPPKTSTARGSSATLAQHRKKKRPQRARGSKNGAHLFVVSSANVRVL